MHMLIVVLVFLSGLSDVTADASFKNIVVGEPNSRYADLDVLGSPLTAKDLKFEHKGEEQHMPDNWDSTMMAGLLEGDITVPNVEDLTELQHSAVEDSDKIWPGGIVPYVVSGAFSEGERALIANALAAFQKQTCVRFVTRKTDGKHPDYVHILKGNGCSSPVGRQGGRQVVSIGYGCNTIGIVIHELMHTVGFWHEQSRKDRDEFVEIKWENIENNMDHNFQKLQLVRTQNFGVKYDYGSLMHYGPFAFSKDRANPTIVPKSPGAKIGQRRNFSGGDLKEINLMYECDLQANPPSTGCRDTSPKCNVKVTQGYCDSSPSVMKNRCRKACGFCEDKD